MRRVSALASACCVAICLGSLLAVCHAQGADAAKGPAPTRLLISRPVEVTVEKEPQFTWIMGLIDAYMRVRFTGRDDFIVTPFSEVLAQIPTYNAVNKPIAEDAYFQAAKATRSDMCCSRSTSTRPKRKSCSSMSR
jgi:hypothetical protein